MTEKMKKSEFIELWAQALESGKYKQGILYLWTKNDRYCCLGVACVIAKENNIKGINIEQDREKVLPKTMSNFLKMSARGEFKCDIIYNKKIYTSLTHLNDRGITFKTIAKIIREQIKAKNFESIYDKKTSSQD